MSDLIPYYRVSTKRQAKSGLGLEAQQEAVQEFQARESAIVLASSSPYRRGLLDRFLDQYETVAPQVDETNPDDLAPPALATHLARKKAEAVSARVRDALIIGAGPVGLFQVFELGLLDIHAQVIDSMPRVGGQCSELYPDKPIYDIPALPVCGAQELIDRLLEQIRPFAPGFHLGQEVTNDIQPDEYQSSLLQFRRDLVANPSVAIG